MSLPDSERGQRSTPIHSARLLTVGWRTLMRPTAWCSRRFGKFLLAGMQLHWRRKRWAAGRSLPSPASSREIPSRCFSSNGASFSNEGLDRPDILGPIHVFHDPRQTQTFSPSSDGLHGSCLSGTTTGHFFIDPTNLVCAAG